MIFLSKHQNLKIRTVKGIITFDKGTITLNDSADITALKATEAYKSGEITEIPEKKIIKEGK